MTTQDVEARSPNSEELAWGSLYDPKLYLNRELSLLEFQRRVLEEAQDGGNPLLERAKFLAIVSSNLDELFMVRIAGLKQQVKAGIAELSPDGLTASEQLAQSRRLAHELLGAAQRCWLEDVGPKLAAEGIAVKPYRDLSDGERARADQYFDEVVFPVLTPLGFDPGHPFPHISHLSLNLAIYIRDQSHEEHFARLKVPRSLSRLVPVGSLPGVLNEDGTVPRYHTFVLLEQIIIARLQTLFPGMEIVEAHPFHVTRDADIDIQELEASDLLESIEQGIRQRQFGSVVRVMINEEMPPRLRRLLVHNLELSVEDALALPGPLDLGCLMGLMGIDRYDLKDKPFKPALVPAFDPALRETSVFGAIRRGDVLVHHPYDSFDPVVEFLEAAANDPKVLAIKQTLYRVGRNSPIVRALMRARENDKQVAVLVELKARFDEESNIGWARALERKGVHVVYGLLGLKTHCKIALVVRKEGERIRRYVHMSTGNYNAVTAHIYTDLGLFTCDPKIGDDASHLFNYLTGYSAKKNYHKLVVAPVRLRETLSKLIRREIAHSVEGRPARLILKTNALVDTGLIRLLYEASQAGVKIDLIVRGVCCLRPGVEGLSENIRVVSVVGRFLEHTRIYAFINGGETEMYLGSADLMPRNLDRRVETFFPVEKPSLVRHLFHDVLEPYLRDTRRAREMKSDGSYVRLTPEEGMPSFDVQTYFLHKRQADAMRMSESALMARRPAPEQ